MIDPKDPADMSQEEHEYWEKQVEDAAELKLLKDVFVKAKAMIATECNGGKAHLSARIAFKGAVQRMMKFDECAMGSVELTNVLSSV
jgi:hypothetical protein